MHYDLDIHPIPEKILYINELGIADTAFYYNTEEQHQKAHLPVKHIGVRPHKEKINISKEIINKTRRAVAPYAARMNHTPLRGEQ